MSPAAQPELAIAFANSGALPFELSVQRNDVPSMYRDFLRQHGTGITLDINGGAYLR